VLPAVEPGETAANGNMNRNLGLKLTNLVLAVLLCSLAIAAVISLLQKSYLSGVLLFLGAAFLLYSCRWSDYGRVSLVLFLTFFYLVAYVTNVALLLTDKKGSNELEEQRLKIVRRLHLAYDSRTPLQVVADLQTQGLAAVPVVYPFELVGANGWPAPGRRLLPLAGISRQTTVFCNECGDYTIYQADEHGFNNPPGLWSPQPLDILLIGDSFSHGACVPPGADLGGLLRQAGRRVLNLGFGGDGPLLELAIIREYAVALKPKVVLWLYFEGNDLTDLDREKKSAILTQYLQNGAFTQDLVHRQGEVDRAWTGYLEAVAQNSQDRKAKPWYRYQRLLETLRSFQLKKLKSTGRQLQTRLHEYLSRENVHLLEQVLAQTRSLMQSWGGTLYVVYLPSYQRYAGQARTYPLNRRDLILATVRGLKIPLIDFHPTLDSLPDPLVMFPFRKNGHYTAPGYRLLSQQILGALPGSP
jgi:hypothetical protein